MFQYVIQAFILVLIVGGFIIVLVIIIRGIFRPRKMSVLKNHIKASNYKAAINVAKDIINKERENEEAHFYLGEAYYNEGKYELALIEFKRAEKKGIYIKIDEKTLREKLAELYIKMGNIDEAIKEYILLTKKYPTDHVYFFKIGELFEEKNMSQQAVKYYFQSVKLYGNYVPALLNLGILLYKAKSYPDANKYLQTSISKDPNNYKAFFYMGMLNKKENNFKNALKNFEKSMRDKEYKIRSLMERGIIYMVQGKFDDAILELDRALRNCENEDNVKLNIRYVLAGCFEKKRNITEAIALWEEIYSKQPNFKDVAEKLADYQDLRMDDRMKDFLTATDVDFIDICKGLIENMGLNILENDILSKDSIEFLCLEPDNKWRNMKKRPKIIHVSRRNTPIDEKVVRKLNDKMRSKGVIRGVVITSSTYSKLAIAYAKERPIELVDKNGLQELLQKASS